MAWITQIRVANSKTVSPKQYESAKAEREFIISFAPGELNTTDEAKLKIYCRDMGQLVSLAVDEGIDAESDVREPSKSKTAPASAPTTQTTTDAPKKDVPMSGLKDKFGNEWPNTITCKVCGTIVEVQENKFGGPMAICDGTEANKHGAHFLTLEGKLGKEFVPNPKKD